MDTNTLTNRKKFKIALYSKCPIWGVLKFKESKGYLKYYDDYGEIEADIENYNPYIMNSLINQAEIICTLRNSTLWSY